MYVSKETHPSDWRPLTTIMYNRLNGSSVRLFLCPYDIDFVNFLQSLGEQPAASILSAEAVVVARPNVLTYEITDTGQLYDGLQHIHELQLRHGETSGCLYSTAEMYDRAEPKFHK